MRIYLRRVVTAILLLGSSLLLMGSTPGCGPSQPLSLKPIAVGYATSRPAWLPDGSAILFSRDVQGTFLVDVAGTRLRKIPGTTWSRTVVPADRDAPGAMSAALSPDGSRVAFVGLKGIYPVLRTADLDSLHATTITRPPLRGLVLFPAWSPDGSQISYLPGTYLNIADADGSNERSFEQVDTFDPTAWSPDGSWIAFVGYQDTRGAMRERTLVHGVLALVRPDGSELTKVEAVAGVSHENQKEPAVANSYLIVLGSLASVPAWSPDASQLAFIQVEEGSLALYTLELAAALEGRQDDARKLLTIDIESVPPLLYTEPQWYMTLSWSPDGTAILFTSEHTQGHVVSVADGRVIADVGPGWAAWSPDGARIAVVTSISTHFTGYGMSSQEALPDLRDVLYTMAQDGTDKQVLVRGNLEQFVAARSDE